MLPALSRLFSLNRLCLPSPFRHRSATENDQAHGRGQGTCDNHPSVKATERTCQIHLRLFISWFFVQHTATSKYVVHEETMVSATILRPDNVKLYAPGCSTLINNQLWDRDVLAERDRLLRNIADCYRFRRTLEWVFIWGMWKMRQWLMVSSSSDLLSKMKRCNMKHPHIDIGGPRCPPIAHAY